MFKKFWDKFLLNSTTSSNDFVDWVVLPVPDEVKDFCEDFLKFCKKHPNIIGMKIDNSGGRDRVHFEVSNRENFFCLKQGEYTYQMKRDKSKEEVLEILKSRRDLLDQDINMLETK